MLADLDLEVADRLGVDTASVQSPSTMFGFPNTQWKPYTHFDGTPALVSEFFNYTTDAAGDRLMYPKGDPLRPPLRAHAQGRRFLRRHRPARIPGPRKTSIPPSLSGDQVGAYTQEQLSFIQRQADDLYRTTDKSLVGCWSHAGIGDIAMVPGLNAAYPKGIRDPQRWYEMLGRAPGLHQRDLCAPDRHRLG